MRLLSAAFGLCAALVLPAMVLPAHAEQSIEANSKTTAAREQTASKDATAPVALAPAHALALHGEPKYPANFTHYDYVNPDAPKGGTLRLAAMPTFDNLHPFIFKGVSAAGASLPFDTLMEQAQDEALTVYGVIASGITVPPDRSWVTFTLRPEARFHDGHPITSEDVVFTFNMLREKGQPSYRVIYRDVTKVEAPDAHTVKFTFKDGSNRQLPLQLAELYVLPKHYWEGKDFSATTLTPPLGSGPYKVATVDAGRSIIYERVKDYWGKDLPTRRGRNNFDTIQFDYYRDEMVQIEAFLAGRYDLRQENTAKLWATAYDNPVVKSGKIIKQDLPNELPAGMQAFVFNQRRPIFQDIRVRHAFDLAFDFAWGNRTTAFGAYKRTTSFFTNTELAARGLPDAAELKILEPFRGKIPDEVFTQEYKPAETDGTGNNRDNLRQATELLKAAGWVLKDGKLVNAQSGAPFAITYLDSNTRFERWLQPYFRSLERLGIKVTYRVVDAAQYTNLLNKFDFDVITHGFAQSLTPGLEQRDYWSSASADLEGGSNIIGIKNPVVDALVEGLIAVQTREDLIAHSRALDRVLQWNRYVVPQWHINTWRLAYWDKFGQPKIAPKYGLGYVDQWWSDPVKNNALPQKQ